MRRRRDLTDFKISIKLKRLYSTLSTSLYHGLAIGRLFLFFSRAQKVFLVLQLYVSFKSLSNFFARLTFVIFLFDKPLPDLMCLKEVILVTWPCNYFHFHSLDRLKAFSSRKCAFAFQFRLLCFASTIYQYGKVTILVRISNRTRICY